MLVGNHRDAWVYGGVDPVSGTAAMLELTRSLGELKRAACGRGARSSSCSWDGEEYALTGSTEWGEQFGDELKQQAGRLSERGRGGGGAATTAGAGGLSFKPSAVASLAPMLLEAAHERAGADRQVAVRAARDRACAIRRRRRLPPDADLVETRIGSGSDHTVFLNHLGRPVMNLGFAGDYGVYHSGYDDHFWMTHIGDPAFAYHAAMARIWGLVALRLANADVLPFDFARTRAALRGFLAELTPRQLRLARLPLASLRDDIGAFGEPARSCAT